MRISLEKVRDAIDTYALQNNGSVPTDQNDNKLKAAIAPQVHRGFPSSLVGTKDSRVEMSSDDPLVANDRTGWMYNGTTGEFIINCTKVSQDKSTAYGKL